MGKLRKYNDKRPRSNGVAPREHYVRKGGSWKAKIAFENEASAYNWLCSRGLDNRDSRIYQCGFCGKFHVSFHYKKEEDE